MTLTLEQVRQTRFHLARRNGYEPVDVDNFVDKVEATLAQLNEENATLKQQLDSQGEGGSIFVPSGNGDAEKLQAELDGARSDLDGVRSELAAKDSELAQVRADLDAARSGDADLAGDLDRARTDLAAANTELDQLRAELEAAKAEAEAVRSELAELRVRAATPVEALETPTAAVENIVVTSSAEASPAVTRLLQMATEQAERLVGDSQVEAQNILTAARAEAETVIDGANKKSHETLTDARTRADRIESEARVNAEKLTAEAQSNADAVNGDAEKRRVELFTQLETERDSLRSKVDRLRSFESNFRTTFTAHLESQIKALREASIEPADVPELMNEPAPESATPRLDALLSEDN